MKKKSSKTLVASRQRGCPKCLMSKTIFLIPGFKTQISDAQYLWLVSYLESKKYTVHAVPIHWNNQTLSQNAAEFINFFASKKTKNNYLLGFPYGAVIAILTAEQVKPKKLILCSLSADFKEDTKAMPVWIRSYIGKRRFKDITTRSAVQLATSLKTETVILYGQQEGIDYPQLKKRCEETAKLAKNSKLIVVKNAPHDISFPAYQAAIKKVI